MPDFFESQKQEFSGFTKPIFMDLSEGSHFVRILQDKARVYFQHWLNGAIECLGEDCPQCEVNRRILVESNGDFKEAGKVKGFNWRQERGAVNILDRTPVKVCPQCQKVIKADIGDVFPAACSQCGNILLKIESNPLNKVRLFTRAGSVFANMDLIAKATLDENQEPVGITNFDFELIVAANQTIPRRTANRDKIEVPEEHLFDLNQATIKLTREEMEQKMRGVSLKDIFSARRATDFSEADSYTKPSTEIKDESEKEKLENVFSELENMFS